MIATIKGKTGKVGEVFHNGKSFAIKIKDEDSFEGAYLKRHLEKLKTTTRRVPDVEFSPPSSLSCKLGRSEKETFLLLLSGLPSFEIEFTNPTFRKNSGDDVK